MKYKVCKIIFSCIIVAVLLAASHLMYFSTKEREVKLIFCSYDGQSSINLGKIQGEEELFVGRPLISIKLDNENIFLEDRIINLGFDYLKIYSAQGKIYYIVYNDGYAYDLRISDGSIMCSNAMTGYDEYVFPFMAAAYISPEYPTDYLAYDEINMFSDENFEERIFNSYEDIKAFYSKIDGTKWYSDDSTSTIYVKSYHLYGYYGENRLSLGYPCVIKCESEGIVFTFDESEL